MKQEYQDVISKYLGVDPIVINSSLVSAQNRVRYYWTNIPNITQPIDKKILLHDILEDGENTIGRMVGRRINPDTGRRDDYNKSITTVQRIESRIDSKSGTLTTVQKDNLVMTGIIKDHGEYKIRNNKSMCIDANYFKGADNHGQRTLIRHSNDGNDIGIRKLTPIECERLQTIDDNYTKAPWMNKFISNTQRYKMLGNCWTVDVISHILSHIP